MQLFTYFSIGDIVNFCPNEDTTLPCTVKSVTFEYGKDIEFMTYYDLEFLGDMGASEMRHVELAYVFEHKAIKPAFNEYESAHDIKDYVRCIEDTVYAITLTKDPDNPTETYTISMKKDNGDVSYVSNLTIDDLKELKK